ncbi:Fic family protein [Microbacterium sp.]|uniref:Fic family protein n=1 Tax=Microbacterium sp. TaxID=51671 RepID=UPI003C774849
MDRATMLLGRVNAIEELSGRALQLRRANRIDAIHSSTAIEGNRLSLAAVVDIADGGPGFGPMRDVQEVKNALAAYDALDTFDPWSLDDFLRAHGLLTYGLIEESGAFRTVDLEIVSQTGAVLHTGSRHAKVPRLIGELLEWGQASPEHPLIVSSAVHYLIEHIHPFRDGNGRVGRLWQTLVLSRWQPELAWQPIETLIREHQQGYYDALQASHAAEVDAAPFIDYMLGIIIETLTAAEHSAKSGMRVGVNGGVNVGLSDQVLMLLRDEPGITAAGIALRLDKSTRTVERYLAKLTAAGTIRREGADKTGHWVLEEDPQ